jgi:hypothetical protein
MLNIDYRTKFKQHYKIDFDGSYVVHHIDGNRENNDIENLMILPFGLHRQYHIFKRVIDNHSLPTNICGNQASCGTYYLNYYEKFVAILHECNKWYDFKRYLDGKIPNIHNIKFETYQEK